MSDFVVPAADLQAARQAAAIAGRGSAALLASGLGSLLRGLERGDLDMAKQAYPGLQAHLPDAANDTANDATVRSYLDAVGAALDGGDLAGAQKSFLSLAAAVKSWTLPDTATFEADAGSADADTVDSGTGGATLFAPEMLGQLIANQAHAEDVSPFKSGQSIKGIGSSRKLTPEEIETYRQMDEKAKAAAAGPPSDLVADNDPTNIYATVTQNGRVVAILYRKGGMETPDMSWVSPDDPFGEMSGIPLAEKRLAWMMKAKPGLTVTYGNQAIEDASHSDWMDPADFWALYNANAGKTGQAAAPDDLSAEDAFKQQAALAAPNIQDAARMDIDAWLEETALAS